MGGIAIPMPKIFTMLSSFSMASLALPGMSGFVAELLVFFGLRTISTKSFNFLFYYVQPAIHTRINRVFRKNLLVDETKDMVELGQLLYEIYPMLDAFRSDL
ncbi:NAD(P)H-quinone oxidoreductase chain 4 chloroplastic [Phtheirospermum japonicum]|uniref:NAD(P)H-quinone oxidoreductase chain 4 chloroplastic n=1 Tax=Phtheirospermum japonicum TaxID=374723 RepID=A0A830CBY8_9LAMI|nr:NAD(P)H-quinone oxidoreductase chain 4 chloroplastic [Phtheirospermum japonicum]